jgi:hypothetical protein
MQPPYMGGAPSGAYASSGSQVAMPQKKSSAGIIAVIVIILVVGGGVAAFLVLGGKKKDDGIGAGTGGDLALVADAGGAGAATGSGPATGSGAATGSGEGTGSSGSGAATGSGEGTGSSGTGAATGSGEGTGSQAVEAIDAGAATPPPLEIDAGSGGGDVIEPISVLVNVATRGATIYVDGKKLGKSPQIVKVKPGETKQLKVKASGYKDESLEIDGTDDRLDITLKSKGGGGGGSGSSSGSSGGTKKFCEANPLHPDCMQ